VYGSTNSFGYFRIDSDMEWLLIYKSPSGRLLTVLINQIGDQKPK
jgi:hypothetical protein